MNPSQLHLGDVIMVTIDGNVVPCTVLTIELGNQFSPGSIRLEDTGSGRAFWRRTAALLSCKRFNNTLTTYRGYSDFLKHNAPDVTVRFLRPAGERKPKTVEITIADSPKSDIDELVTLAKKKLSHHDLLALLNKLDKD